MFTVQMLHEEIAKRVAHGRVLAIKRILTNRERFSQTMGLFFTARRRDAEVEVH